MDASERYLHLAAVMQTRTLSVVGQDLDVQSGDGSAYGQEIADAYRMHVVETEPYHQCLSELMSAVYYSYAVVQPVWNTETRPWTYSAFVPQDPRLFRYDNETMRELRIVSQTDPDGIEIQQGSLVIHTPKVRPGLPIRGGLARSAVLAYLFSSVSLRNWAAFVEVFGGPLRVVHYDPATAGPSEISRLKRAAVSLATDGVAFLPEGQDIDIKDWDRGAGSNTTFADLASAMDALVSKLFLGQTMTSDVGKNGSRAQAEVHERVARDIAKADARALFSTEREQICKPWVEANYPEGAPIPIVTANVEPPKDLVAFSQALAPLLAAGLRVGARELRERYGLREPIDGEELVTAPPKAPPGNSGPSGSENLPG